MGQPCHTFSIHTHELSAATGQIQDLANQKSKNFLFCCDLSVLFAVSSFIITLSYQSHRLSLIQLSYACKQELVP